jgi:hypothetical protein
MSSSQFTFLSYVAMYKRANALPRASCLFNACKIAKAPLLPVRNAKQAAAIQNTIIGAGNQVCQICQMALEFQPVISSEFWLAIDTARCMQGGVDAKNLAQIFNARTHIARDAYASMYGKPPVNVSH